MTDDQLLDAINADATLLEYAIAGRDGDISRALSSGSTATPMTVAGLLGLLSAESLGKLATNPNVVELRNQVMAQDVAGVALWAALFVGGGVISQTEHDAIIASINNATPNAVSVSVSQVNRVLRPFRADGKVGQSNWTGA